ncbi:putative kinesin [Trypanosoma conorhini]|uniref:Putative kinesin n=1 Tax=Trypanosoma conorhini TaxID=83891 RepID=A0A422PCI8_9TRYP|nr:putative kinesin [Trypanosoma conorhini]RNF15416.1 putative kinesin [Trypanosoma conorhini]
MAREYPDDGHIFVCVRVRDVATVPGMAVYNSASRRSTRDNVRDAQRICVSTLENFVVLHDPRSVDDASCVARDADGLVQLLTARSGGGKASNLARRYLTSTATASYFEYDKCLNSMDADSMLQMPLVRDSDFIRPPGYGTQEDVYLSTAVHAVGAAVEGINSCVFAYGQTGSGKTFTLFGDTDCLRRDPGVVPRTIDDLFQRLESIRRSYQEDSTTEYSYRVQLSFFEIYQNEVYCLFSRKGPLRVSFVRDVASQGEAMTIHGLQQQAVASAEKAYPLLELGLRRRQTGETGMNARSSRSHAVLQVRVTQWRTNRITKESVELNATLNLVDLAGSERQKTAKTDGKSRDEGIQINQSLATLARVINDISHGAKYVNYRDSLLTMVLKDNLGGNSKTFMIATIAPVSFCYQESCATLLYAKDVRKIRNRPMVNRTFQTRSNLLELNARLREENEQLKNHVDLLMRKFNTDTSDAAADAADNTIQLEKATGVARGCAAAPLKQDAATAATEAVIAAPAVGAVPLVVTAHRKYTSVAGIGGSCLEGGCIGVTSLSQEVTQFRLADMLHRARSSGVQPQPGDEGWCKQQLDYGVIEFELVSQRACEQRYWLRYLPSDGAEPAASDAVECQVNGLSLKSGGRRQLRHGDVVSVFLDSVNEGSEQDLLTFHYVDTSCLSRGGGGDADTGVTTGDLRISLSLPNAQSQDNAEFEQLRRDKAKLLEVCQEQARTIEYQCQREAESRSRMVSMATAHRRERGLSFSPNPVRPLDVVELTGGAAAATPQQAGAAARAFYRTSVSPSIRYEYSVDPQRFEDCVEENQLLYKDLLGHNAEYEELQRRLAELDRDTPPKQNPPPSPPVKAGAAKNLSARVRSSLSAVVSVSGSDESAGRAATPIGARAGTQQGAALAAGRDGSAEEEGPAAAKVEAAPTANEILLKHSKDPELQGIGRMQIQLSTSEGVLERHHAAKRERVLCERILALEQALDDLRKDLNLVESKLRIARDKNTEHELGRAQMEDEMKELAEAFSDATKENAALRQDINSLETLLGSAEEALAEMSAINEAELDTRLARMAEEIRALKLLAHMWKRRAMQRLALRFSDAKGGDKDDVGGEEAGIVSGQVPWDELRVESNAARAKKLLGEHDSSVAAVDAIDRFEKETAFESVVALEKIAAELENENLRFMEEIKAYEAQVQGYKELVERLRAEKEELEREEKNDLNLTVEEMERIKAQYAEKCEALALAERQCAEAVEKLRAAKQKKTAVKKKSVNNDDLLLQEHRRVIEEREAEYNKLSAALASKENELRTILAIARDKATLEDIEGFRDEGELRDRIEELLATAMEGHDGGNGYSVFPPDFQFSDEVTALIRVCLRIMMDRLKIELYVLNRQSLHKFGLLVPAVELRPEAQFRTFMHELRQVVADIAGKAQRIGGKWSVEESDVLSRLVDHRRRRAGNALNGLLIWYDHWDLSPKAEHVSYMELIRNMERVMQLARLVRQGSLVNTNATSTLRLVLPGKRGSFDTEYAPTNSKDTSVTDSLRILEKHSDKTRRSNLARVVKESKAVPSCNAIQRSQTFARMGSSPRRSEMGTMALGRSNTTFTPLRSATGRLSQRRMSAEKGAGSAEGKFGRRATALVVPVSDNDVTFVASSAVARSGSAFNFERNMSAVNVPDAGHPQLAARGTRFARANTEVPSFAALAELYNPKSSPASTPRRTAKVEGAASSHKKKPAAAAPPGRAFHRARTSIFSRTNTAGVPQLSSRISGRQSSAGTSTRASGGGRLDSPKPSIPASVLPRPFYDPRVLSNLRERSTSEGNQASPSQEQKRRAKLTRSKLTTGLTMPPRSSPVALSRTPSALNRTSMRFSEKGANTVGESVAAESPFSLKSHTPHTSARKSLGQHSQRGRPDVPPLYLKNLSK